MTLTKDQRQHLGQMLGEGANLIMAATVIADVLERKTPPLVLGGVLVAYILVVIVTTWMQKKER